MNLDKVFIFFGITIILLASINLTACGAKGPLYLPEQRYPQDTK